MAEGRNRRRLAAIMIADIVGYSRLIERDEERTHRRVENLRREVIVPAIDEHRGNLVRTQGDGFLSMFDSPVECVRCAMAIQQHMADVNVALEEHERIRFRIGINIGDVIVEPEDIYGDGVNIAARLEQLAEPGAILISGSVYEHIRTKLVVGYQSLGERRVKNIQVPIPIYRVLPDSAELARAQRGTRGRRAVIGAGAACVVAIAAVAVWQAWTGEKSGGLIAQAPVVQTPMVQTPTGQSEAQPVVRGSETPAPSQPMRESAPLPQPVRPAAAAPVPLPLQPPQAVRAAPEPAVRADEPQMLQIAGGAFQMGSQEDPTEKPVHRVTVESFLLGKFPVTNREWRTCVKAGACSYKPPEQANDDAPVGNVSWKDAQAYVAWLSTATGKPYRLPSEAEWEYAARGGTASRYWWGEAVAPGHAVCRGCGEAAKPIKVGTRPPNPFGLHDINGGMAEWVQDCRYKDYTGAPTDGSAREGADCTERVLRGGSWLNGVEYARPASRLFYDAEVRYPTHGFRVARSQ
jgi:formylglycine-generating enzyme required for sulfatase activity/class 3 adenylate cyclase